MCIEKLNPRVVQAKDHIVHLSQVRNNFFIISFLYFFIISLLHYVFHDFMPFYRFMNIFFIVLLYFLIIRYTFYHFIIYVNF